MNYNVTMHLNHIKNQFVISFLYLYTNYKNNINDLLFKIRKGSFIFLFIKDMK